MLTSYKSPAYVEELTNFPRSISQVETAIPAFIGYTEKGVFDGATILNKPKRIKSLIEFEQVFGMPQASTLKMKIDNVNGVNKLVGEVSVETKFRMYYALQLFYANGGGACYINSVGSYSVAGATSLAMYNQLKAGLDALQAQDEVTMLLCPDALTLNKDHFYQLYKDALKQCSELRDRVAILDLYATGSEVFASVATDFYNGIGDSFLSYGAAYYPYLKTALTHFVDEASTPIEGGTIPANSYLKLVKPGANLSKSIFHTNPALYSAIITSIKKNNVILPPSSAVAGVYCTVDNTRGVWKAPANISLNSVVALMSNITEREQADMNVTPSGKSVNAIRSFVGKGVLVWGARTLAGNDNEWRYVSVRRFFIMIEESIKKGTHWVVFEQNNASTWIKVKGLIENFLTLQWRNGALMGVKPKHAFYVRVGLGQTMTAQDILEGRMIIEIGLAVVRPAEFVILRILQKVASA